MPRSDEAEAFFHAVCAAVQEIPRGRVTSYGHIATLIGTPQRPRQVGICLKHLPASPQSSTSTSSSSSTLRFHTANVPWQRVIAATGRIAPRAAHPEAATAQATALRDEGVVVDVAALGELIVDLERYGWFPSALPSEARSEADNDLDHGGGGVAQANG